VILYVAPRAGPTHAAFVASRRVGGAVARNRARRIMRAAWRELRTLVEENLDVVFVARESIQGAKTQDLEAEMQELLRRMKALRP
jgi:ribonuclease P protein component